MRRICLIVAVLVAGWLGRAAAEVAVPPLQARVTDLTGALAPDRRQALEELLRQFEARKGAQVSVLIVPTTAPETIEQYGIRVAEAWQIGRKGVDDGAILLVARDDRALRFEVGYGLEGAVPDAVAKRIVDEIIVPRFKEDDFAGGIEAGLRRLLGVIEGEPLPPPPPQERPLMPAAERNLPGVLIGTFILSSVLRRLLGRLVAAVAGGILLGAGFWLATGNPILGLGAGGVAFLLILVGGRGGHAGGRGGWHSSSGGGGFSSSGGGFSGGGGHFGGGGASGRW